MMQKSIYIYAWDLAEEGVATVTGRLRDAGLDSVAVATSYHAGKFLRPHAPRQKVYFPEDGTVYFRPNPTHYGRIKPRVNALAREFDALRELERAAPDMKRIGWTVGLHNTSLGMVHPEFTAQNVFGDRLFNSLCPAQPEVRKYLAALCVDLGRHYALSEIVVETPGWQTFRHGHHHEFELVELSPRVETMLGMCFCNACMTGAKTDGIDVEGLMSRTRSELEQFLADGCEPPTDLLSDAEWQAFIAWRARTVTGLVGEVRAILNPDVRLAIIPTVQTPNRLCWIEGSDVLQLVGAADRLEVPAYQTGVAAITSDVNWVRQAAGGNAHLGFILRPSYPHLRSVEEVAAAVRVIRGAGADSVAFYNYGHLRLESLTWIRTALS